MPTLSTLRAEFTVELGTTSRKVRTLFDGMVREHGLTLPRARALLHLSRHAPINQTELAAVLEIEGSSVVRLLDGLEEQGLVERSPVEGDRRAKQVGLTDAAAAQVGELQQVVDALRTQALRGVERAELEVALGVLRKVAHNVGAGG